MSGMHQLAVDATCLVGKSVSLLSFQIGSNWVVHWLRLALLLVQDRLHEVLFTVGRITSVTENHTKKGALFVILQLRSRSIEPSYYLLDNMRQDMRVYLFQVMNSFICKFVHVAIGVQCTHDFLQHNIWS